MINGPAFIDRIINADCDFCAIGHFGYVIGEAEHMDAPENELRCIDEEFGERDFLLPKIVTYLRSLGLYLDPGSPASDCSENRKTQ